MFVDDALHDGKPDSGAFIILRPMEALEDAEQLVGIGHVESNAVVPDKIGWIR
jgi:hypothetical protein